MGDNDGVDAGGGYGKYVPPHMRHSGGSGPQSDDGRADYDRIEAAPRSIGNTGGKADGGKAKADGGKADGDYRKDRSGDAFGGKGDRRGGKGKRDYDDDYNKGGSDGDRGFGKVRLDFQVVGVVQLCLIPMYYIVIAVFGYVGWGCGGWGWGSAPTEVGCATDENDAKNLRSELRIFCTTFSSSSSAGTIFSCIYVVEEVVQGRGGGKDSFVLD